MKKSLFNQRSFSVVGLVTFLFIAAFANGQNNFRQIMGENIFDLKNKSIERVERKQYQPNHSNTVVSLNDSTYYWWGWNDASGIWTDSVKDIYEYDGSNNQTRDLYQTWQGGAWTNQFLQISTFDINNNPLNHLNQIWDSTVWKNNSQYLFLGYDTNNNLLNYVIQNWDSVAWVNGTQKNFTYDLNNNQTSSLTQTWDSSAWLNYLLYSYTYDINNNITAQLTQTWDSISWLNVYLNSCTYDVNNNRLDDTRQNWDGSAWGNASRNIYTYDINNNLIADSALNWNVNDSDWVSSIFETYTYDINNNRIGLLYQYWNPNDTIWVIGQRNIYSYDVNNNLISYLQQYWVNSAWENAVQKFYYWRTIPCSANFFLYSDTAQAHHYYAVNNSFGVPPLTYDWSWGDGAHDYIAYPSHAYADTGHYTICLSIMDSVGCSSTYCDSSVYLARGTSASTMVYVNVVSQVVTDAPHQINDKNGLNIYPNPAGNQCTIHNSRCMIESAEVYNVLGKNVNCKQSTVSKNEITIDVSDLNGGIYFVKVQSEKGSAVRKLVIE